LNNGNRFVARIHGFKTAGAQALRQCWLEKLDKDSNNSQRWIHNTEKWIKTFKRSCRKPRQLLLCTVAKMLMEMNSGIIYGQAG
jgi:hypothetical protein